MVATRLVDGQSVAHWATKQPCESAKADTRPNGSHISTESESSAEPMNERQAREMSASRVVLLSSQPPSSSSRVPSVESPGSDM